MSRADAQQQPLDAARLVLDDLFAVPALQLRLLSDGRRPQPPVTWVAPTDLVDPTPFLTGGELVFTTGALLAALGCDIAQGWAIARPMPVEDFLRWLERPTQVVEVVPDAPLASASA